MRTVCSQLNVEKSGKYILKISASTSGKFEKLEAQENSILCGIP